MRPASPSRRGEILRHAGETYRLEERIAEGNFGPLYAGRDGWGNPLLIRVLRPFSRTYEAVRERWLAEIDGLAAIAHPGLVHVHAGFEHAGSFHLVLERCEHRLDRVLQSPAWDGVRWHTGIAGAVLGALDRAHRAGCTHKNLQPANVFFSLAPELLSPRALFPGAVKVGGLAEARLLGDVDVLNTLVPQWMVPPEYLSPSELGPLDHRADVYQAGLLLLAVLLGRIPRFTFAEVSTGAPAKLAAGLECDSGAVLARALQPRVDDRFATLRELWRELSGEPRDGA